MTSRRLVSVALAVAALALAGCSSSSGAATPDASSSSSGTIDGVESFEGLTQDHTTDPVEYPQSPPVGGPHDPEWIRCTGTVYDQPVRNENAVHSMEHGAVWIAYDPALSDEDVATLAGLVEGVDYSMVSPYPGLDAPVSVQAWGLQLKVDSVDDPRIAAFVEAYAQGPQTPEPGAACTGGVMPD